MTDWSFLIVDFNTRRKSALHYSTVSNMIQNFKLTYCIKTKINEHLNLISPICQLVHRNRLDQPPGHCNPHTPTSFPAIDHLSVSPVMDMKRRHGKYLCCWGWGGIHVAESEENCFIAVL
jgi:hypothetical protein